MDKHGVSDRSTTSGSEHWGPNAPTIDGQEWPPTIALPGARSMETTTVTTATTILARVPAPTDTPSAGMAAAWVCVCVRAWIPSSLAYMLIAAADGSGLSFHRMDDIGESRWSLALTLRSGNYRYRYYTDLGTPGVPVASARPDAALACLNADDGRITVPSQEVPTDDAFAGRLHIPFC